MFIVLYGLIIAYSLFSESTACLLALLMLAKKNFTTEITDIIKLISHTWCIIIVNFESLGIFTCYVDLRNRVVHFLSLREDGVQRDLIISVD